jgi:hypothetical protein
MWIDATTNFQYNFVCDTILTNTSLPYSRPNTPNHDYVVFKEMEIKEEESKAEGNTGYNIIVIASCLILILALAIAAKACMNYFKLLDIKKSEKNYKDTSGVDEQEMSKTQLALKKKATQEFLDQYDPNKDFNTGVVDTNAKLNTLESEEEHSNIATIRKKWKKGDTGGQMNDSSSVEGDDLKLHPNF